MHSGFSFVAEPLTAELHVLGRQRDPGFNFADGVRVDVLGDVLARQVVGCAELYTVTSAKYSPRDLMSSRYPTAYTRGANG